MIGSLSGKVADIDPEGELLVEVAGVGYRVSVTAATLAKLGETGSDVHLWISQVVRDDTPRLFGFSTRDERHSFEILLKAQGVGPALAQAVLSHLPPDELRRVVMSDDTKALTVVSGVGLRTAQRMMIDLKSKLGLPASSAAPAIKTGVENSPLVEVREGLATMGFSQDEIKAALAKLPDSAGVGAAGPDSAGVGAAGADSVDVDSAGPDAAGADFAGVGAAELMRLALQAMGGGISKGGAFKDGISKGGASKSEVSKGGASKSGVSKGGASKSGVSKGGASKSGVSKGEASS